MKEKKKYYSLPLEQCFERIEECYDISKMLKTYIKDRADDDESWNSDLMTLLCEYYAINSRYLEVMNEIILTPTSTSEETGEEVVLVEGQKYALLTSYSKLMISDEMELKHNYRVHLFMQ